MYTVLYCIIICCAMLDSNMWNPKERRRRATSSIIIVIIIIIIIIIIGSITSLTNIIITIVCIIVTSITSLTRRRVALDRRCFWMAIRERFVREGLIPETSGWCMLLARGRATRIRTLLPANCRSGPP